MSNPSTYIHLDQIRVYRGETFTVWLDRTHRCDHQCDAEQVELRVLESDGRLQIFVSDKSKIELLTFDEWSKNQ